MSGKNVRAQNATIRPFRGIGEADVALEEVRLLVDDAEEEPGPVPLSAEVLASAKFALALPEVEFLKSQIEKTGIHVPDCGLIVIVTGRTHRGASTVVYNESLAKAEYDSNLALPRMPDDLALSDRQGCTITVALVLRVDYAGAEPLRPSMAGTWLARRDFKITTERDLTSFSPEPLTEQVRKANNLPVGVMRFIDYRGSVATADDISEVVTVYVDPTVLGRLFASETKASSLKEQTELAIQAYSVMTAAMLDEIRGEIGGEPSETDLAKFPVAEQLLDYLAGQLSDSSEDEVTLSRVLKLAKTPGLLASHLEVAFGMRETTLTAL